LRTALIKEKKGMKLRDCIKILSDNIKIKKGKILITEYEEYLDFEVKSIEMCDKIIVVKI
jgi:hypothetical protein